MQYIPDNPGPFVDVDTGKEVGLHQGIHMWTVGQRCRIGGCLQPYFVASKQPETRTIFVVRRLIWKWKLKSPMLPSCFFSRFLGIWYESPGFVFKRVRYRYSTLDLFHSQRFTRKRHFWLLFSISAYETPNGCANRISSIWSHRDTKATFTSTNSWPVCRFLFRPRMPRMCSHNPKHGQRTKCSENRHMFFNCIVTLLKGEPHFLYSSRGEIRVIPIFRAKKKNIYSSVN